MIIHKYLQHISSTTPNSLVKKKTDNRQQQQQQQRHPDVVGSIENMDNQRTIPQLDFSNVVIDPTTNAVRIDAHNQMETSNGRNLRAIQEAQTLLAISRADPTALATLRAQNPRLAEALNEGDEHKLTEIVKQALEGKEKAEAERARRLATIASDPLSVESQRLLEEEAHQQTIDDQLTYAQEHLPETFGHVVMLYVPIEVNGTEIKAFVDSGAQSTIMSRRFAEKCNLLRQVDKRFYGVAHGVGQSQILGRIHTAQMKIKDRFYPASITVLEDDKMDFLLGLDMLRRHQMCIDLSKNVLRIDDLEVSFLSEKDLKDVHPLTETSSSSSQSCPSGETC